MRVMAAADRPVWFPGNPPPKHLDGTLAGGTLGGVQMGM